MLSAKEQEKKSAPEQEQDERHILVAVDETESSKRALLYVADFLGGQAGIRVTVLRIIPKPSEDYFPSGAELSQWLQKEVSYAEDMLSNYREILIQSGFESDMIDVRITTMNGTSIAGSILEQQKELNCCTIVVGRRVVSRKEEFLFGSTSNALLHAPKSCAVWVVE